MTTPTETQEQPQNNKDYNFRALEAKVAQERAARLEAEKKAKEYEERLQSRQVVEDDDDSDPYVDRKKLEKRINAFDQQNKVQTRQEIQQEINRALHEERKNQWFKENNDYNEVIAHAEKFAQRNPAFANSILNVPDEFERQKLAYQAIKSMNLHLPEPKVSSVQQKIDENRRSPYYQPSGMGTAPYAQTSDFSQQGQSQAYQKMQELKKNLRLG